MGRWEGNRGGGWGEGTVGGDTPFEVKGLEFGIEMEDGRCKSEIRIVLRVLRQEHVCIYPRYFVPVTKSHQGRLCITFTFTFIFISILHLSTKQFPT